MPDVHSVVYYFGDLPVYMRLNLACEMGEMYRIQGSRGLLEVNGQSVSFTPQLGVDTYPCYYDGSFPRAMREAYEKQWHAENDEKFAKMPAQESMTYRMADNYDDYRPHLANFFNSVRTRQPVVEDVVFGHNAALACHMANESYFRKTAVMWDTGSRTIRNT